MARRDSLSSGMADSRDLLATITAEIERVRARPGRLNERRPRREMTAGECRQLQAALAALDKPNDK